MTLRRSRARALVLFLAVDAVAAASACIEASAPPAGIDATTDGGGGADGDVVDATTRDASDDGAVGECRGSTGALVRAEPLTSAKDATVRGLTTIGDDRVFVGGYTKDVLFTSDGEKLFKKNTDGNSDAFVVRRRADGTIAWQVGVGGTADDVFDAVTTDDEDNVYVGGSFDSSILEIGGVSVDAGANAKIGGLVVKFDRDGVFRWVRRFNQTAAGSGGCSALDHDAGHLVVACAMGNSQTYTDADGQPAKLRKFTYSGASAGLYELDRATGNAVWANVFGTDTSDASIGGRTVAQSVDVTGTSFVVAGVFDGDALQDGLKPHLTLQRQGIASNGFVAEFGMDGVPIRGAAFGDPTGNTIGSTGGVQSARARGSSDGGILVAGSFAGRLRLGEREQKSQRQDCDCPDAYFARLDRSGGSADELGIGWSKTLGSATGRTFVDQLRKDDCGGTFLLRAEATVTTDDGVTFPGSTTTPLVGRIATDGTFLWSNGPKATGADGEGKVEFADLFVDAKNQSIAAGRFKGSVDLGDGTVTESLTEFAPVFLTYGP